MGKLQTLEELGRWADDEGLGRLLRRPYEDVLDELGLPEEDDDLLRTVCDTLGATTMQDALQATDVDRVLAGLAGPRRVAELVESVRRELHTAAEMEEDDERPYPLPPAPVTPVLVLDPKAAPIEAVPLDATRARAWAEKHGVSARLADPASVLQPVIYTSDPQVLQLVRTGTIGDALAPPQSPPKQRHRWEHTYGMEAVGTAARRYLYEAAQTRAAVLWVKSQLDRRAKPPTEPSLVALAERIVAARAVVAAKVTERPIGTYDPGSVSVEEAPLRVVYTELANLRYHHHAVRVALAVEEDPLVARCSCPRGEKGACEHALSVLDAAFDVLRDPLSPGRKKLLATLGVPIWQRFLRAFGDELTRREGPAPPEDLRLAWRISGHGAHVELEPLIQKRLKGGGWSVGQRTRVEDLRTRRALLADPHDARVFQVLTAGLDEVGGMLHGPASRGRMARTIEALAGHPRAFLGNASGTPVRIARRRLRVALDAGEAGVVVSFLLGERRYSAVDLRVLSGDGDDLIALEPETGSISVCALDERAQALITAFEKHPARFPPESYDELLRGMASLQESVDLAIPEALAGESVEADARPVVRLSPQPSGEMDVEVLVRPVEGGPAFPPGEGAPRVLHAKDGKRVAAQRDLAREVESATRALERLAPGRDEALPWSFHLEEDPALDLIGALRDLGDEVVVEWPEPEKRIVLSGIASRKELRIRVTDRRDWFGVEGEVEVDGDAIPLAMLLDAVRRGRRYVRVGPGKFAEIAEDLRQRVAAADDVLHPGRHGLEVGLPGIELLSDLVEDPGHLQAAARWRELRRRIDAARTLDPAVPAGLTATLRHYQVEGYKWLARLAAWGSGACLADDMGLGKTVEALALLLARAEMGPQLVIAPTSVGPNWIRETERFAPGLRPLLYRGLGRSALLAEAGPGHLLVTSYALALRDAEALSGVRFASIVLDEAQAIKNAMTRRARAVRDLDADLRIALTGTPVENHLGELWSLMRIVAPGLLGSWEHFRDRFAGPIERDHDAGRSAALARLVRPFLLRRTKGEVAPELPPRTEIERFVDLSAAERRLYDALRRDALEQIASGAGDARFALLAALTRLRRLACHPRLLDDRTTVPSSKLAALLEIVDELREEGHRALVFSQFTTHLALVREALDRRKVSYEYLDGATPSEERTKRIDAFQGGRSELFLISLKAGGTGLNLTAADYVIHLDPWWNPAVEDQATDRAHRIGQTKAVTVIRIIARGTIEEAVLALHADKRALAASVFDEEGGAARLSLEDLAGLIRAGAAEAPAEEEGDAAGDEVVSGGDDERRSRPPKRAAAAPVVAARIAAAPVAAARVAAAPVAAAPVVAAPAKQNGAAPHAPQATGAHPDLPAGDTLVSGVIGYLAKQRGIAEPRYDATLRSYERSLKRFAEYVGAHAEVRGRSIDEVVEGYVVAIKEERWPVPPSERGLARTVTNHLKAYLRSREGGAGATASV